MKTIALTILAVFMMATLTVSTGFAGEKAEGSPSGAALEKSGEAMDKAQVKSDGMNDKAVEKAVEQKEKVMDKVEDKKADADKGKEVAQEAKELKGKALGHSKN